MKIKKTPRLTGRGGQSTSRSPPELITISSDSEPDQPNGNRPNAESSKVEPPPEVLNLSDGDEMPNLLNSTTPQQPDDSDEHQQDENVDHEVPSSHKYMMNGYFTLTSVTKPNTLLVYTGTCTVCGREVKGTNGGNFRQHAINSKDRAHKEKRKSLGIAAEDDWTCDGKFQLKQKLSTWQRKMQCLVCQRILTVSRKPQLLRHLISLGCSPNRKRKKEQREHVDEDTHSEVANSSAENFEQMVAAELDGSDLQMPSTSRQRSPSPLPNTHRHAYEMPSDTESEQMLDEDPLANSELQHPDNSRPPTGNASNDPDAQFDWTMGGHFDFIGKSYTTTACGYRFRRRQMKCLHCGMILIAYASSALRVHMNSKKCLSHDADAGQGPSTSRQSPTMPVRTEPSQSGWSQSWRKRSRRLHVRKPYRYVPVPRPNRPRNVVASGPRVDLTAGGVFELKGVRRIQSGLRFSNAQEMQCRKCGHVILATGRAHVEGHVQKKHPEAWAAVLAARLQAENIQTEAPSQPPDISNVAQQNGSATDENEDLTHDDHLDGNQNDAVENPEPTSKKPKSKTTYQITIDYTVNGQFVLKSSVRRACFGSRCRSEVSRRMECQQCKRILVINRVRQAHEHLRTHLKSTNHSPAISVNIPSANDSANLPSVPVDSAQLPSPTNSANIPSVPGDSAQLPSPTNSANIPPTAEEPPRVYRTPSPPPNYNPNNLPLNAQPLRVIIRRGIKRRCRVNPEHTRTGFGEWLQAFLQKRDELLGYEPMDVSGSEEVSEDEEMSIYSNVSGESNLSECDTEVSDSEAEDGDDELEEEEEEGEDAPVVGDGGEAHPNTSNASSEVVELPAPPRAAPDVVDLVSSDEELDAPAGVGNFVFPYPTVTIGPPPADSITWIDWENGPLPPPTLLPQ